MKASNIPMVKELQLLTVPVEIVGHVKKCEIQNFHAIGHKDRAADAYVAGKEVAQEMCRAINGYERAMQKLQEILAECPQTPLTAFGKKVKTLALEGLNGSR